MGVLVLTGSIKWARDSVGCGVGHVNFIDWKYYHGIPSNHLFSFDSNQYIGNYSTIRMGIRYRGIDLYRCCGRV